MFFADGGSGNGVQYSGYACRCAYFTCSGGCRCTGAYKYTGANTRIHAYATSPAVDVASKALFVSDQANRRVQKFRLSPTTYSNGETVLKDVKSTGAVAKGCDGEFWASGTHWVGGAVNETNSYASFLWTGSYGKDYAGVVPYSKFVFPFTTPAKKNVHHRAAESRATPGAPPARRARRRLSVATAARTSSARPRGSRQTPAPRAPRASPTSAAPRRACPAWPAPSAARRAACAPRARR